MTSPRTTTTTPLHGDTGGTEFNDRSVLRDINTAIVTRIVITSEQYLRSIAVHYADSTGVTHGAVTGDQSEIVLEKSEFICTITGNWGGGAISQIAFETNKGRKLGPYGRVINGNSFVCGGFGPGMGLLYLEGKESTHIISLRATFAMYQTAPVRPAVIRYEKHVATGANTRLPVPLSHFATNLMSPTVKLLIGPDSVVFQTSQEILCRLPFFRAALQGGFVEASAHTINMPEDEPQIIAALIEFLYTGSYSFPYLTTSGVEEDGEEEVTAPPVELPEGEYHVSVYATAHKYGCTKLEDAAFQGFKCVLGQLKGVDVLHLWRSAYAKDLYLKAVENEEDLAGFRSGLGGLLRDLFLLHPTEMEKTSADYPTLVHDLLRLVVCNE